MAGLSAAKAAAVPVTALRLISRASSGTGVTGVLEPDGSPSGSLSC